MAKDLFIKYLQGTCTGEEFEQLLLWIRDKSHTLEGKEMIQKVWEEFEPEASVENKIKYNRILDKVHHRININQSSSQLTIEKKQPRQRILTLITRVAAVLLLPVLLLLFYSNWPDKKQYAGNNLNDLEVVAPAGSRMHLELGDGTSVWLNNGSKLRYPYRFSGNNRKVVLTGEGYFEVAHNNNVPFLVETDHVTVKATGTSFNVSAYPGDHLIETTLVEGKVILLGSRNGREIKAMSPNECVAFNFTNNQYTIETANIGKNIAWKDGLLVFKRDPIEEVAKKLGRWYNIEVEITSKNLKRFTYTATFADEPLPQVLELMAMATPISYILVPREKLSDGSFSRQKVLIGLKNDETNDN